MFEVQLPSHRQTQTQQFLTLPVRVGKNQSANANQMLLNTFAQSCASKPFTGIVLKC